jgi:hypothetical protein
VIGYYVHHVGAGHLHRALAVAERASSTVTGLSSLPRPDGWPGEWVRLARDDESCHAFDPTAGGRLHWVPQGDAGLRQRMAALSRWIDTAHPGVMVSDVSVEVTLLARLHGIPVVSVVLPGARGDRGHRNAFAVSSGLVAAWPAQATGMVRGLAPAERRRLRCVGGLSRLPVGDPPVRPHGRSVLVLSGRGGGHPSADQLRAAAQDAPGWHWQHLGGSGDWCDDPAKPLDDADVVVIQAGQSAVADVAARRRPAIVVPAARPFGEQLATAMALRRDGWPCEVVPELPEGDWAQRLERAADLDASRWSAWCDGHAADRMAEHVESFTTRRRRAG